MSGKHKPIPPLDLLKMIRDGIENGGIKARGVMIAGERACALGVYLDETIKAAEGSPDYKALTHTLANRLAWLLSCPLKLGMTIDVSNPDADEYNSRSARDVIADDLDLVPGFKVDRAMSNAMDLPPKQRMAYVKKWKKQRADKEASASS